MQVQTISNIAFLLIVILTTSCLQLYNYHISELLSPAKLVREDLYLSFFKKHVAVKMSFKLNVIKDTRCLTLYFPGKNFPVHSANKKIKLLHLYPSNFRIKWQGKKIKYLYRNQLYEFQLNFKKKKNKVPSLLTIKYNVPYKRHYGKKYFTYILRTGRVWSGSIGRLIIHINGPEKSKIKIEDPYNKNLNIKNIEPVYDLVAEYNE